MWVKKWFCMITTFYVILYVVSCCVSLLRFLFCTVVTLLLPQRHYVVTCCVPIICYRYVIMFLRVVFLLSLTLTSLCCYVLCSCYLLPLRHYVVTFCFPVISYRYVIMLLNFVLMLSPTTTSLYYLGMPCHDNVSLKISSIPLWRRLSRTTET